MEAVDGACGNLLVEMMDCDTSKPVLGMTSSTGGRDGRSGRCGLGGARGCIGR